MLVMDVCELHNIDLSRRLRNGRSDTSVKPSLLDIGKSTQVIST